MSVTDSTSSAGCATGGRVRWRVPRGVAFVVLVVVLLCVHFALLRAGLLVRNRSSAAGASAGQIAMAFLVGLRFDLATACFIVAPFAVAAHIPAVGLATSARRRRMFLGTFLAVVAGLTFVALAEYEFFREFQTRYNQVAIQYLDNPRTVAGMAWYAYPVVRYVLVWALWMAVFGWGVRWLLNRCYRPGSSGGDSAGRASPVAEVAWMVVLAAVVVVGMRGGVQAEPLRWGDAYGTDNDFANELGLNGLYTLARASYDHVRRGGGRSGWARSMSPEEARRVAGEMVLDPTDRRPGADEPTLLRAATDTDDWLTLKRAPGGKPLNVVLVIMESFSGRFVGALGAPGGFTPEFDKLAADGVLFTRLLSSGTHTHQGVFSTLLGFPNLPGHEYLMDQVAANQPFPSLPSLFKRDGYQTMFLYNGDLAWDNMRGFLRKQGVDHFVGGPDFPNSVKKDRVWGVSDKDLFDRANVEFQAAAERGPFFGVVLTLSNHAPFDLPKPIPFAPTEGMGELDKRLDGVRYADWAVGQFVGRARALPYFDNTLFVFVGDHGFHVDPKLTEAHLLYHHVPLLFYAPRLLPGGGVRSGIVAGQTSVAPTIAALARLSSASGHWGRNLFGHADDGGHFAVFKGSGGDPATAIAEDDHLLVIGVEGRAALYRFDLGFPPSVTPVEDPARSGRMERQLRGYVQAALADLDARRASSPVPGTELLTPSAHP